MNKKFFGIESKYWLASILVWTLIVFSVVFPQIVFSILLIMWFLINIFIFIGLVFLVACIIKDTVGTIKETRELKEKG